MTIPPKPNPKLLEERWLHKTFVLIYTIHQMPLVLKWGLLLLNFGLHFLLWQIFVPAIAVAMIIIFGLFVIGDLFLLWQLPRQEVSYGEIEPALLLMTTPRWGVSLLAFVIALWLPVVGFALMIALQVFGSLVYLWSLLAEPHQLTLTTLEVQSPHLPPGSDPIRLLHLSDIHVERLTRREAKVLDFIAEAKPDLIVMTGDYLNLSYRDDPEAIRQVRTFLPKIQAPHGVYATLGSPPVDLPEIAAHHFDDNHIHLLRHDMVNLDLGQGRQLTLLGMDCTHDMAYDDYQFKQLYIKKQAPAPTVFLYHSPEGMPFVQQQDVDLYLCGHTHGGQVRLPGYGAILTSSVLGKRYEMGRYDENNTTLYISRGIGLEGMCAPRLRLLCKPEMTLVLLKSGH